MEWWEKLKFCCIAFSFHFLRNVERNLCWAPDTQWSGSTHQTGRTCKAQCPFHSFKTFTASTQQRNLCFSSASVHLQISSENYFHFTFWGAAMPSKLLALTSLWKNRWSSPNVRHTWTLLLVCLWTLKCFVFNLFFDNLIHVYHLPQSIILTVLRRRCLFLVPEGVKAMR